jgi:predicted deacetylase
MRNFAVSADSPRLLCISLHDVAPATLDDCMKALAFLDGLGLGPVALLVVPDYHGLGRADRDDRFASFIESRILRGDEIVLHGYRHVDAAPPARGVREWLTRRVYAESEGEFSQLDFEAARTRILRGLVVLRSAGWHPTGFVAPAWLMSAPALSALEETPLQYCATRDAVVALQSGRTIPAPSLVVSSRPAWRRAISPVWNKALLARHATSRVVRAALHPADLRYPALERLWRGLLSQLEGRAVVTEAQLVPPPSRRAIPAPYALRSGTG